MKLNFGCGDNRLIGWKNFDAELDISKRLPFDDNSANYIFCEHCVEHIPYYQAIEFFKECRRVLKPTGVVRIVVPSIEKIWHSQNHKYYEFTTKWQSIGPTDRGAMHAILYAHGHQTAWTASLLESTLYYAGFDNVLQCSPHLSAHGPLNNVEGHHKAIGEEFNAIESIIFEGTSF